MTQEMMMALGAFVVFFLLWVVVPTVVKKNKSGEEE